jgi:DNA-binding XRE family transcriptional regulator
VSTVQDGQSLRCDALARSLGIPTDTLAAIEESVYKNLDRKALRLEFLSVWREPGGVSSLVPAELTGKARQFVLSENVARETALQLHPIFLEAACEYAELLTRTIIEHYQGGRAIHWKAVADRAIEFCIGLTAWEESARWLYGPIKAVGLDWKDLSPRSRPAYLAALPTWMLIGPYTRPSLSSDPAIESAQDLLRSRIREIARLAPTRDRTPRSPLLHADRGAKMGAAQWRDFHQEFMRLADEEERLERATPRDRFLRAYCDYSPHPEVWAEKGKSGQGVFCLVKTPETGLWMLSDGLSENFQARVRTLACRAGITLDCPTGCDAEDFWFDRLFRNLLENDSDQLFAASKKGGVIPRLCLASATFCARLEKEALGKGASEVAREAGTRTSDATSGETTSGKRRTDVGRKIDTLRKECGWSFEKLARETGIDKKLILSHVNKGTKPRPRILREYAQAFSRKLGRTIIAPDLES